MKRVEGEERLDLNDPTMPETQRAALTEFWNKRYHEAPAMDPGGQGDDRQKYGDYAADGISRAAPGTPTDEREQLVKAAAVTREGSVKAGRDGFANAATLEADHRAALSALVNHDREHGHPIADLSRDLNKPGEQPSLLERDHFMTQHGMGSITRLGGYHNGFKGQEGWRDDRAPQPQAAPRYAGQKWYEPDHLAQQRVQKPEQAKSPDSADWRRDPVAAGQQALAQHRAEAQQRPQLASTLAGALGHKKR